MLLYYFSVIFKKVKEQVIKPTLLMMDSKVTVINSPHVVILGAGASRASFPDGDKNGIELPLMCDLAQKLN